MKTLFLLIFLTSALFAEETDFFREKAEKGDVSAMLSLGDHFFYGEGKQTPNYTLAAYWYRRAAEQGNADGMFNYGLCLDRGYGVVQDQEAAFHWYEKASKAGSSYGTYNMAMLLLSGIPKDEKKEESRGIASSPAEAKYHLRALAEQHFEPAEILLAELLLRSKEEPENAVQAVKILIRLSGEKNPPPKVFRMLADCIYAGVGGLKRDPDRILSLLNRAVESGDAEAAGKLAYFYEYGMGIPADDQKAFSLYKLGAERGNPMSQYKYAEYLISGRPEGQKADLSAALHWFYEAEKGGNPQAIFRLGVFLYEGMGPVKADQKKAADYFYRAAKAGYAPAQYNLACMYAAGEGGLLPDEAAASYWFMQAARKGDPAAIRCIGLRYLEGKGLPRSISKGERFLERAAELGDHEAERVLNMRKFQR